MVSGNDARHEVKESHTAWRARLTARLNREAAVLNLKGVMRPAAVLIPIVAREEPALLLTKRTEHLPTHAGQVCFPGGRFHETDASLAATALREFEEETGVAAGKIEVAGFLDAYETSNSGFLILPVVGFLSPDYTLNPNEHEVAEAFEAPLSVLFDPENRGTLRLERGGTMREFPTIEAGGHIIWGATYAMIANLAERLEN